MRAEQPLRQDEQIAAVQNAGFRWAYYCLFFGLLFDCFYRYRFRNEDIGDLLALAVASAAVITVYLIRHKAAALSWRKFLFAYILPRIPLADLPALLAFTLAGCLVAGCYGVLHDQITFWIGPEYFYNFKFHQFSYADLGLGDRVFVSCIGFLATWWVGLIIGWILARRILSTCPKRTAYQRICAGFLIVFATAASAGILGYLYGLWRGPDADYSAWQPVLREYRVSDVWPFMRVAYIHNAGYIGGLVGLLLTYFAIRPGVQPFCRHPRFSITRTLGTS
jgi:hypothetical protein